MHTTYRVPLRRRREGRTDYAHRLKLLRSGMPRAVVRRSNRYYIVQFISFGEKGDAVIASANSRELRKKGWNGEASNSAAAYLTGLLAAHRAKEKGVEAAVLDAGLISPRKGSGVYAALRGMLDAGLEVPHDDGILPTEERIQEMAKGHCDLQAVKSGLVV